MAIVVGAGGGIGSALLAQLQQDGNYGRVIGLSRQSEPPIDVCDESSVKQGADWLSAQQLPLRLVVVATGTLHSAGHQPEKSWQQMDPQAMAEVFAINTIGPALVIKHLLPLLPREGRSVFAVLSAKVGSIGDNRLGGWYSYRASKAALNQLVHTAAIELRRRQPEAVCASLHPGTVETALSAPFSRSGLDVKTPAEAAQRLLGVIAGLRPEHSGGFFNHDASALPW
jgi:NAD(P)-dependent dehydrogenase (short-subunit alcohol dehydrogenase family)